MIAKAICKEILDRENLIASAGVAPNKFLAKIASGWKKPNGFFVITPEKVSDFVHQLPIEQLFGVGKVTAEKLHQHGIKTCADLQKISFKRLVDDYGKLGERLYEQCRGIDHREVESHRARKSLSVERTFAKDIHDKTDVLDLINSIYEDLVKRLALYAPERDIKNIFIKIKFSDFKQKTAEIIYHEPDLERYSLLFKEATFQEQRGIRLLGLGVHFHDITEESVIQEDMFNPQ